MWRVSSTDFAFRAHPEEDWGLLRKQLSTASTRRATGTVPPLVLLADEIAGMARFNRETRELPFGTGSGAASYQSLIADLESSVEQLGPALRDIAATALGGSYDPAWSPDRDGRPRWSDLFAAGDELLAALRHSDALIAAFDDALDATLRDNVEAALAAVVRPLDELRAIAELQRGPWVRTQRTIEQHLTVRDTRGDLTSPGQHTAGTDAATILAALHGALRVAPEGRDYAVWIGTLAGPSPELDTGTVAVIAGPIAVSGIACTGDIGAWIAGVRKELSVAFTAADMPVPADVLAFGEPSRYRGVVVAEGEELWDQMASPPSFVARVAVRATNVDEAVDQAREALRAVYDFSAAGISGDLRADAVVWSETGGWAKPSSTGRGRAVGEPLAARHASSVVAGWADDLGAPLDGDKLDLLRSRALVRDTQVAPEVRLMRAFASLEALTAAGCRFDDVAGRLWVRNLRGEAQALQMHLINLVRDPHSLGPPRDGAAWEHRDERLARFAERSPHWGLDVLDAVDEVLEVIHPDAMVPALARAVRLYLTDPRACEEAKARHAAAIKRARRYRNLATHGHRVADRVLLPTVAFLADQLEHELAARIDRPDRLWLGSLATIPDVPQNGWTVADVLAR